MPGHTPITADTPVATRSSPSVRLAPLDTAVMMKDTTDEYIQYVCIFLRAGYPGDQLGVVEFMRFNEGDSCDRCFYIHKSVPVFVLPFQTRGDTALSGKGHGFYTPSTSREITTLSLKYKCTCR